MVHLCHPLFFYFPFTEITSQMCHDDNVVAGHQSIRDDRPFSLFPLKTKTATESQCVPLQFQMHKIRLVQSTLCCDGRCLRVRPTRNIERTRKCPWETTETQPLCLPTFHENNSHQSKHNVQCAINVKSITYSSN